MGLRARAERDQRTTRRDARRALSARLGGLCPQSFGKVGDSRRAIAAVVLFLSRPSPLIPRPVFFFFPLSFAVSPHRHPSLTGVIFSSLPARHRSAAAAAAVAALSLFPDINYVPVGRTLRRRTHRCASLTSTKATDPVLASLSLAVGVEISV